MSSEVTKMASDFVDKSANEAIVCHIISCFILENIWRNKNKGRRYD